MAYCSTDDVYRIAGITSSEISAANVTSFIQSAEAEIDRFTGTTWLYNVDSDSSGTATSATSTTLVDTGQSWTTDEFEDFAIYIKNGTGSGQTRDITTNTGTAVTVSTAWTTNPDSTSEYEIFYAQLESETGDGDGSDTYFTKKHPLFSLESLTIDSTSVTTSEVYQYTDSGKLTLKSSAETSVFSNSNPQLISLTYYYGVRPKARLKYLIRDFTATIAGIMALTAQIGGTFDDITSYSLPEFTASKGEPYTNIRETIQKLKNKMDVLKPLIPRYVHVG